MKNIQYVCIVCPRSCRITVEESENDLIITGNACPRGAQHARNEHTYPMRMLTSTVKLTGSSFARLPVISNTEIPKNMLVPCLEKLKHISVSTPVICGSILIENICGTGANILAARTVQGG